MLNLSGAVYKKCVKLGMLNMSKVGGKIPSQKGDNSTQLTFHEF